MLAAIDESVVAVASKNTRKGEMPDERTVDTLRANGPLAPVQEPAPAVIGALTATVVDCWVLPPGPVQFKV